MSTLQEIYIKGHDGSLQRIADTYDVSLAVPVACDHVYLDIRYSSVIYFSLSGGVGSWVPIIPTHDRQAKFSLPAGTTDVYFRKPVEPRLFFEDPPPEAAAAFGMVDANIVDETASVRVQFLRQT